VEGVIWAWIYVSCVRDSVDRRLGVCPASPEIMEEIQGTHFPGLDKNRSRSSRRMERRVGTVERRSAGCDSLRRIIGRRP
jgi:hypothetical protein